MTASLLWLAAGLTPWVLGLAGTTSGLLAYSIERERRRKAEAEATRPARGGRGVARPRPVRRGPARRRTGRPPRRTRARHHRLAGRQGLRCTWGRGVTNDPNWS